MILEIPLATMVMQIDFIVILKQTFNSMGFCT